MQIYYYYSEIRENEKKMYIWARDLSVNSCELLTIIVVFFVLSIQTLNLMNQFEKIGGF
jgi:hypothetical protein